MKLISKVKLISPFIIGLALSACATNDYVSQLSQSNYGLRVLPSVNLDPSALMYGPFAPKPSQVPCFTADYRCSPQTQLLWADFAPR